MRRGSLRRIAASLLCGVMLVQQMALPGAAADKPYYTKDTRIPAFVRQGEKIHLWGSVCSPSVISELAVCICQEDGTPVRAAVMEPRTTSFQLNTAEELLRLEELPKGCYLLRILMTNAEETDRLVYSYAFRVGQGASPQHAETTTPATETVETTTATTAATTETTVTETTEQEMTAPPLPGFTTETAAATTPAVTTVAETTEQEMTAPPLPGFTTETAAATTPAVTTVAETTEQEMTAPPLPGFTTETTTETTPTETTVVPVADPITLTGGMTVPENISEGTAVIVQGVLHSASALTSVTAGVYNTSGVLVTGKTVSPGTLTYDLHTLDRDVLFTRLQAGDYEYRVTAVNAGGEQIVERQSFCVRPPEGLTYIRGILVVNKTYSVPSSYNPGGLLPEVQSAFSEMAAAAKQDGLSLWVYSGFRSYARQTTIYNNYCAAYGQAAADTFSARPGHSEHQTGMAIDVNSASDSFAGTREANWLAANSYRYGFIIRYPQGKQSITGFKYEPWHVRYVGRENALALYSSGLTLEEYLGIDSVYR